MKIALVTMIRNEQDILNVFLNHIDALFDEVYLLDHRSIDSSTEILKNAIRQRKNWIYVSVDILGYYQKEISNLMIRKLFEVGADCVIFMDCDEFILLRNRVELEKIVEGLNNSQVAGSLRWFNCVPDVINRPQIQYETIIWKCIEPSKYVKVMIPKSVYNRYQGKIFLAQGNHMVLDADGKVINALEVGTLLHIPVRSRNQMVRKVIQTSISHFVRIEKKPSESFQLDEMLKLIISGMLDDDWVRGCVNLYQEVSRIVPISKIDLTNGMYQKTSLKRMEIATTQAFSFVPRPEEKYFFERTLADQILSWEGENPNNLTYDAERKRIFIRQ